MKINFFNKTIEFNLKIYNRWHSIKKQPPDKLLQVMDEEGNIGFAYPTYYPFKTGENKTGRRWGTEIIPCKPYWDGGWMIQANGLTSNITKWIVKWRDFKITIKKK